MSESLLSDVALPVDAGRATLVGRLSLPGLRRPVPVLVSGGELLDISRDYPTVASLTESADAPDLREQAFPAIADLEETLRASLDRDRTAPRLLSPIDLHCVKASGVTFVRSLLERVIEERAHGDPALAAELRDEVIAAVGTRLEDIQPGSSAAALVKEHLLEQGLWSQYLEVGIGPDAEIFTKCPVLASVGFGSDVGVLESSEWNNPEPEVVLIVSSKGTILGASLGNDVNLRDVEGRSALLLGRAKDNNASAAIGPFVRLFDDQFSLDDVRDARVSLTVEGPDGFRLDAASDMTQISRDPEDLVEQLFGSHHQYPDGAALYLGTGFAPTQDRKWPGSGFTHVFGDAVSISSPRLGTLMNRVNKTTDCEPWVNGIGALIAALAERNDA